MLRVLAQDLDPPADRALGHAHPLQDRIDLGLDGGDLLQADVVDVLGAVVGGGEGAQGQGVGPVALRQLPGTRVLGRMRALGLEDGDLAGQGRLDLGVDHAGGLGTPVAAHVALVGLADQRLEHGHVIGRRVPQRPQLGQGLVHQEAGQHDAERGVGDDPLALLIQQPGEGREARDEGFRVGPGLEPVLVGHEVRDGEIGPGSLRHHIGTDAAAVRDVRRQGRALCGEAIDGQRHLALIRQAFFRHRLNLRPAGAGADAVSLGVGDSGLAQLTRKRGAGTPVEAEVGRILRRQVDILLEPARQHGVEPGFGRRHRRRLGRGRKGRHQAEAGGRQHQAAAVDHRISSGCKVRLPAPRRRGREHRVLIRPAATRSSRS